LDDLDPWFEDVYGSADSPLLRRLLQLLAAAILGIVIFFALAWLFLTLSK